MRAEASWRLILAMSTPSLEAPISADRRPATGPKGCPAHFFISSTRIVCSPIVNPPSGTITIILLFIVAIRLKLTYRHRLGIYEKSLVICNRLLSVTGASEVDPNPWTQSPDSEVDHPPG